MRDVPHPGYPLSDHPAGYAMMTHLAPHRSAPVLAKAGHASTRQPEGVTR
jgi:hypothetical protein